MVNGDTATEVDGKYPWMGVVTKSDIVCSKCVSYLAEVEFEITTWAWVQGHNQNGDRWRQPPLEWHSVLVFFPPIICIYKQTIKNWVGHCRNENWQWLSAELSCWTQTLPRPYRIHVLSHVVTCLTGLMTFSGGYWTQVKNKSFVASENQCRRWYASPTSVEYTLKLIVWNVNMIV